MAIARQVWNHGLSVMLEHEQFTRPYLDYSELDEKGKPKWKMASCCPLPWSYRRIDPNGKWEPENFAPFSPIIASRKPYRMACPATKAIKAKHDDWGQWYAIIGTDYKKPGT